jgi:hypothetical protein
MTVALILTFSPKEKEPAPALGGYDERAQSRVRENKSTPGLPLPFWGEEEGEEQLVIPMASRKHETKRMAE